MSIIKDSCSQMCGLGSFFIFWGLNTDLSLAEALGGVAASGVREVGGVLWLDSDVVVEGDVLHLNIIVSPPAEELDIGVVVSAGCGLGGVKVSHAFAW